MARIADGISALRSMTALFYLNNMRHTKRRDIPSVCIVSTFGTVDGELRSDN